MSAHAESEDLEAIENYLSNALNAEEKARLESRLLLDATLQEEVASFQTLVAGIRASQRKRLLGKLRSMDVAMDVAMPASQISAMAASPLRLGSRRSTFYAWAAVGLLLILLLPTYYFFSQRQQAEALFTQYFSPHQESELPISPEASRQYLNGHYASALHIIQQTLLSHKQAEEQAASRFYEGNALLALHKPQEAIKAFEAVLQSPSNRYRQESEWYLVLSYLQAKQARLARPLAERIAAKPEHKFAPQATALLRQL